MSSSSEPNTDGNGDKSREERLANLSGAMALARLTHQVKELELQKNQQDKLVKPTFIAINCIIDTTVLVSSLEAVKRWTTEGGVNVVVPLTVLDELDKSKKGTESINIKSREVIRYLDRRIKARPTKSADYSPSGSLRIQGSEEMFSAWEDCEKLGIKDGTNAMSSDENPRHFRAMMNCALYQRSKGNEFSILTEDEGLATFAKRWNIIAMTGNEMETTSTKAVDKYHRDMKAYETRKRTEERSRAHNQRSLWTPHK